MTEKPLLPGQDDSQHFVSPRGEQRVEIGDEIGVRSDWLGYLTGRFQRVFDLPNDRRPRWTVTDAHAVRALIEEVESVRS